MALISILNYNEEETKADVCQLSATSRFNLAINLCQSRIKRAATAAHTDTLKACTERQEHRMFRTCGIGIDIFPWTTRSLGLSIVDDIDVGPETGRSAN
ncbi:hypothetical protein PGT21_034858 [Puccinia graminis f. sp. tritici]|uniref:Uncharacterized protein n=1 Tax=Puccinia graminis f. sp. tritici TaxID=56615 RepID=A0A5B0MGS9_PUCGR|nr:hypothetical protein PGT21_034858 [Puccinia graminis f. sp. tritici]